MNQLKYEKLDETIYLDKLDNGLTVYVLSKPDYQKTYAAFTTKYGSIDSSFEVNGNRYELPDGIAHFLEHKMFEQEEGDVFNTFASQGASTNAFTSFNRTTYLFSSTGHIKANIETLLDFVQNPYFTDENVEKEKGIIAQEIRMYEDNPDWRLYFGLIQSLYEKHPVRVDIAGSVESIYKITKDQLYTCYETFYHPDNMTLFIVTDLNPQEIIDMVRENQAKKSFKKEPDIKRIFPDDGSRINQPKKEINLQVALPKVLIGFKEPKTGFVGTDFVKRELVIKILMEIMFGKSSDLYEELLNKSVIDEDFSFDYQLEKQYAFSLLGGNSKNPEQLIEKIDRKINNVRKNGIDEKVFERIRKKYIGGFLRRMNSPEFIANQFTKYIFNQANLFDILTVLEGLDTKKTAEYLDHFNMDLMAVSIVRPT